MDKIRYNNLPRDYYYDKSLKIIDSIKDLPSRPILGLHSCCGPCSTYPLKFLYKYFKIKILYINSNIYPKEEYQRRLEEQIKFVEMFNKDYDADVEVITFDYDNESYNKLLEAFKDEVEGGKRCFLCYRLRMNLACKYCVEKGYDYFTTVMSISSRKNALELNKIGEELESKYPIKYFYSDFKKHKGMDQSIEMRKHYNLYSQSYCGCIYSYKDMERRMNEKK